MMMNRDDYYGCKGYDGDDYDYDCRKYRYREYGGNREYDGYGFGSKNMESDLENGYY